MGKTIGNTLDSAIKRPTPMNIYSIYYYNWS